MTQHNVWQLCWWTVMIITPKHLQHPLGSTFPTVLEPGLERTKNILSHSVNNQTWTFCTRPWMRWAGPSQGYSQQYVARTHLYTSADRDNVECCSLSRETTQWQRPGLQPQTFRLKVQCANHCIYTRFIKQQINTLACHNALWKKMCPFHKIKLLFTPVWPPEADSNQHILETWSGPTICRNNDLSKYNRILITQTFC